MSNALVLGLAAALLAMQAFRGEALQRLGLLQ